MICLNCKKQIPDDSTHCPHCGTEVFHKIQLAREIGFRRYQRWIFYGLFILVFLGMIGIVVKVYSINTKLLSEITNIQTSVSQKEAELTKAKNDLAILKKTEADLNSANIKVSDDLKAQIKVAEDAVAEKTVLQNQYDQSRAQLAAFNSNLKNLAKVATDIATVDLNKIPLADIVYSGPDIDSDGLPDALEGALNTNASSTDSDGDGYGDRAEIIGGFDPLVFGGRLPTDNAFANAQKGRIFKQYSGYLWYVGSDAKRYFLGKTE